MEKAKIDGRANNTGVRLKTPHRWQVVVGNIGTVYDGPDKRDAMAAWNSYKSDSIRMIGKAAGEQVFVMCDDHIYREYNPKEAS